MTAIDVDPARLHDAEHNAVRYGVADRIAFRTGRAERLLADVNADLVFIDPPWGRDWDRIRTVLDDLPVLRAILEAAGNRPWWAKVPPSFLPPTDVTVTPVFGEAEGDRQRIKFLWLRRPRPQPS